MDDSDDALAKIQCGFDGIGDAAAGLGVHRDAVGDNGDVVFTAVIDLGCAVDVVRGSVDSNTDEALLLQPSEEVGVLDLDGDFLRGREQ